MKMEIMKKKQIDKSLKKFNIFKEFYKLTKNKVEDSIIL